MRISITTILSIILFTASGQENSLLGKYTQSFFMYEFYLTLDSGNFVIDEYTDFGSRTTVGTWTRSDEILKLVPTNLYQWDQRNKEKKEVPLIIDEIIISIDNQYKLRVVSPEGVDMTYKKKELEKIGEGY